MITKHLETSDRRRDSGYNVKFVSGNLSEPTSMHDVFFHFLGSRHSRFSLRSLGLDEMPKALNWTHQHVVSVQNVLCVWIGKITVLMKGSCSIEFLGSYSIWTQH